MLPPALLEEAAEMEAELAAAGVDDVQGAVVSRRLQEDEAWQRRCNQVQAAIISLPAAADDTTSCWNDVAGLAAGRTAMELYST